MRIGPLEVTFHRTVRVADGRTPSNLPPSLGRMNLHPVSKYRKNCPESWANDAYFMALHDVEAMWMSFHPVGGTPLALLVGAGGINALDGEKLGTVLAKDNYMVSPPQPWLDGWKDQDGTVYQFVATPHKGGDGNTVAEQLIGKESKTGAVGIAVFEPKDPSKLKSIYKPHEGYTGAAFGGTETTNWAGASCSIGPPVASNTSGLPSMDSLKSSSLKTPPRKPLSAKMAASSVKKGVHGSSVMRSAIPVKEMGVGKGGKIVQKIYPDPHGLDVWNEKPSAVFAVYLVDAATAEAITGEKVAAPVASTSYGGNWFGLQDQTLGDVSGSTKFSGLKSAAFTGDKSNVETEGKESEAAVADKGVA